MADEKKYDLEARTEAFSLGVRDLCRALKMDVINRVYISQVVRSAGSVAANYIEANEKLGDKDLRMRIKICKKESKETRLWLRHILTNEDAELENKRILLIKESEELMLIFAAILRKLGE
jgi:four helix bundle protein